MNAFKIETDEGFMEVELPGIQTPARFDIFIANDRCAAAFQECEGQDTSAKAEAIARALAEFGIPAMSYRAHLQITQEIARRAMDAQKKDGMIQQPLDAAGSPDSTDSAPTVIRTEPN